MEGLAEAGFLSSENVFELERAPRSLVFIGGGPVSVEMAQAFNRLGIETTVLQRGERILVRDEPDLVARLVDRLEHEGVRLSFDVETERVTVEDSHKVVHGTQAGDPRRWEAEEILVGAGRRPNVEGLGLEEVGVKVGPKGIEVDDSMRTTVPSIYACGDVAGRYLFTHSAAYEGVRAVRTMFFPGRGKGDYAVPWCTFTDPELAHAGLTIAEARERHGDDVEVFRRELSHSDRARADSAEDGEIVIVTARKKVVGAHILAPAAGELIHELALAIQQGMKLGDVSTMVHVYPTLATTIQQLAGGRRLRVRAAVLVAGAPLRSTACRSRCWPGSTVRRCATSVARRAPAPPARSSAAMGVHELPVREARLAQPGAQPHDGRHDGGHAHQRRPGVAPHRDPRQPARVADEVERDQRHQADEQERPDAAPGHQALARRQALGAHHAAGQRAAVGVRQRVGAQRRGQPAGEDERQGGREAVGESGGRGGDLGGERDHRVHEDEGHQHQHSGGAQVHEVRPQRARVGAAHVAGDLAQLGNEGRRPHQRPRPRLRARRLRGRIDARADAALRAWRRPRRRSAAVRAPMCSWPSARTRRGRRLLARIEAHCRARVRCDRRGPLQRPPRERGPAHPVSSSRLTDLRARAATERARLRYGFEPASALPIRRT